jgi:hypothetical protein
MNWAEVELETINLGDKRLNKRAVKLLDRLGGKPNETIPSACRGWSETKAAYRFFTHKNVTCDEILKPHKEATLKRMELHDTVLLIQDTTQLNYSGQKQKECIGPLNRDNHNGILLHPTIAVTGDGICLGVIDGFHWQRKELHHKSRDEKNRINLRTPITEKESYRWINGYKIANDIANQIPNTRVVSMSDREGDIYDLYHESVVQRNDHRAEWLVRAVKSRPLLNKNGKRKANNLWESVQLEKVCCYVEFEMPARKNRLARKVKQVVRVKKVTLHPPTGRRGKLRCGPVEVNALIATELYPPKGEKPIEWFFITSLPIDDADSAKLILQYYLCRWQIEVFFRIYKSGCQVEKLQLTTTGRMSPCLTLYLIIAWRILYMTLVGRYQPLISCEFIFDEEEWQTIYLVVKNKNPPKKPPTLYEVIRMVAILGGFLNRKNDGEPGPTPVWLGLQRVRDFMLIREISLKVNKTYG